MGIDVISDEKVGQDVLDLAGDMARLMGTKKSASKPAVGDESPLKAAAISETDVAKVAKKLETTIEKAENLTNEQKKSASETASVSSEEEHQPTVVSNADGTKVIQNLETTIEKAENLTNEQKKSASETAAAQSSEEEQANATDISSADAAKVRKDAEIAIRNVPNIQRFKNANGETCGFTEEVCTTNNDEAVCMVNMEELVENILR